MGMMLNALPFVVFFAFRNNLIFRFKKYWVAVTNFAQCVESSRCVSFMTRKKKWNLNIHYMLQMVYDVQHCKQAGQTLSVWPFNYEQGKWLIPEVETGIAPLLHPQRLTLDQVRPRPAHDLSHGLGPRGPWRRLGVSLPFMCANLKGLYHIFLKPFRVNFIHI